MKKRVKGGEGAVDKALGQSTKEKAQRKTKWNRRFHIALFTTLIVANLYLIVDIAATNRTTRALNQQMPEVNQRWSNIIDQIQERLDAQD